MREITGSTLKKLAANNIPLYTQSGDVVMPDTLINIEKLNQANKALPVSEVAAVKDDSLALILRQNVENTTRLIAIQESHIALVKEIAKPKEQKVTAREKRQYHCTVGRSGGGQISTIDIVEK